MRIIVGLGNPGNRYTDSRHNVGFAVVEELARRWRIALTDTRQGLRAAETTVAGERIMLVQPQMYMNLSGDALAQMTHRVQASDMVVVHDDLDLELGRIRVKSGGGTAGHHGLDSMVAHFGAGFTRLRIGVGKPPRDTATVDHVLAPFDNDERSVVCETVQRAADAVECILREGETAAMNRFNVRPKGGSSAVTPIGRK